MLWIKKTETCGNAAGLESHEGHVTLFQCADTAALKCVQIQSPCVTVEPSPVFLYPVPARIYPSTSITLEWLWDNGQMNEWYKGVQWKALQILPVLC